LLGNDRLDTVALAAGELEALSRQVTLGLPAPQIIQRLSALRCEPLERPFERLAQHARTLAQRLGKGEVTIEVDGGGVRLDPRRWSALWLELVHVVRNAIDHGFEPPEERRGAGKLSAPRLRLGASLQDAGLVIEIEDDGRGIDWEAVKRVASERRLPAETEADLLAVLLAPGVSTRREVTDQSGRGMGMAAVDDRVRELGGVLSVSSRAGGGTCWRCSFPRTILRPHEGFAPSPLGETVAA
jgi:two-component system chemotaxis sensor kinase CheA